MDLLKFIKDRQYKFTLFRFKFFGPKIDDIKEGKMGLLDKLKDAVRGYVLKKGIYKGAKAAAVLLASIQGLKEAGVEINVDQFEQFIAASAVAGITMILNYLKVKTRIGEKLL